MGLVRFEWDARKARVSFQEASSVFFDPLAASGDDPDHSASEMRFVTFGVSSPGRFLWLPMPKPETPSESSAPGGLRARKENSMKKVKGHGADELRSQYKRSDFGVLIRGKYLNRLQKKSNVVVLDPSVAELFPNSASVNSALLALVEIARRPARRPRTRGR